MGIGSHKHVKVVTEEIAFPVGVPSPVTIRLRIRAFAAAGRAAFLLTITVPLFALLCGSADGSAIAGKSEVLRVDQSHTDRTVQELLLIEPEDQKERIFRL